MSKELPPQEGDFNNDSAEEPQAFSFKSGVRTTEGNVLHGLALSTAQIMDYLLVASSEEQTAPQDAADELIRRGVIADSAKAKLFGKQLGFPEWFKHSLPTPGTEVVPLRLGQAAPGYAISEAPEFTLSLLPEIPSDRLIVTAPNLVDMEWFRHSVRTLLKTTTPYDFTRQLWQPSTPLCSVLEENGRGQDYIKQSLELEAWLLGDLHLTSSQKRFNDVKQAWDKADVLTELHYLPKEKRLNRIYASWDHAEDRKAVLTWPGEITGTPNGYSFREFITNDIQPAYGKLAWANLGDKGDRYSTQLPALLGRISVNKNCHFLSSTRVYFPQEEADINTEFNFHNTEWHGELPPYTRFAKDSREFLVQLMEGFSVYPTHFED